MQTHLLNVPLVDSQGAPWGKPSGSVRFSARKEPEGAIVFIHGFAGAAEGTWRGFPACLTSGGRATAKAASYDIYSYAYDWRLQVGTVAIEFGNFLSALMASPAADVINPSIGTAFGVNKRLGRWNAPRFRYRRIVLCAHSLGAIVSRRALLNMSDAGVTLNPIRLLLFAPAHCGARIVPLMSLALGGMNIPLADAVLRYWIPSLDDLDPRSKVIEDLAADTESALLSAKATDYLKAHVLHAKYERVVHVKRFVQDNTPHKLGLKDNHLSICKPESVTHIAVASLLNLL